MLGIPRSTIYELIRRGELRSVRVGGAGRGILLVPAEELVRLLKAPAARNPVEWGPSNSIDFVARDTTDHRGRRHNEDT